MPITTDKMRSGQEAMYRVRRCCCANSLSEMFGLLDSVRRVLDLRPSETDNQQQVHNALNVLEDQLEDQWKPRQDERPPSPGHLYVGSFSKATPSKCLRLYCSSSSTTQPQNQTTQSSIVLSRITTSPVCPPLTVAGLPVATLSELPTGSSTTTPLATPLQEREAGPGLWLSMHPPG
uniref:glucocorticoid modulatory element-binding protein 1-like n=1 Tax=Oncorhynchus gorbuscha TaxID=8017 RepID=UPI001EAF1751|nr:glucocorticoid modulatory element-binding protein 1-like [Oncorhynchus gorbuscha]XP_046157712.1 glucocorticoid modulatory element-binding protein 1-like [Oncorhynchus gorbuscha]